MFIAEAHGRQAAIAAIRINGCMLIATRLAKMGLFDDDEDMSKLRLQGRQAF